MGREKCSEYGTSELCIKGLIMFDPSLLRRYTKMARCTACDFWVRVWIIPLRDVWIMDMDPGYGSPVTPVGATGQDDA